MGGVHGGIQFPIEMCIRDRDIPTVGSLLYNALLSQDMYLAGTSVFMLTAITIVGTFISDILLVVVDPRIRLQ